MLLAMDTSTQWMGLALYDGVQVVGEKSGRRTTITRSRWPRPSSAC